MLTHEHRFHGHGSLRYLFSKGQSSRTKHLMLRYTPNTKRRHSRYAVIVSKKISKRAVIRNRIRRRLFESIRLQMPENELSFDVSITVFSLEILTLPADEITRQISQLLSKLETTATTP